MTESLILLYNSTSDHGCTMAGTVGSELSSTAPRCKTAQGGIVDELLLALADNVLDWSITSEPKYTLLCCLATTTTTTTSPKWLPLKKKETKIQLGVVRVGDLDRGCW